MLDFTRNRSGSIETMLIVPSFLHSLGSSTSLKKHDFDALVRSHDNSMEDIVEEVRRLFEAPLEAHNLLQLSRQMQGQFKERLRSDTHCMLPSYNHTLPHGNERGTYLALDVGGSTLRVALVELYGRSSADGPMRIMRMETSCIDDSVKALKGLTFFDWLAARVEHMLLKGGGHGYSTTPLPMGLSWSFPIAYGVDSPITLTSTLADRSSGRRHREMVPYLGWEKALHAPAVF